MLLRMIVFLLGAGMLFDRKRMRWLVKARHPDGWSVFENRIFSVAFKAAGNGAG